jgi:hypothetical protein
MASAGERPVDGGEWSKYTFFTKRQSIEEGRIGLIAWFDQIWYNLWKY